MKKENENFNKFFDINNPNCGTYKHEEKHNICKLNFKYRWN